MILKYSVGLDASGKDIKASISTIDREQKVGFLSTTTIANSKTGFQHLECWIKKWRKEIIIPLVICMEATGVYHENCALYLFEKQFAVSIILPNKAKKYLQAIGLKSKNDKINAKGLAQMGAEQKLTEWKPAAQYFYTLRTLTRQYQSVQEFIVAEKSRLHAQELSMYVTPVVIKQIKKLIKILETQLELIVNEIEKHLKADDNIYEKFKRVCKLRGISLISGATIIAETTGFELFENYKQLVSYSGYDVVENQSGNHVGKTRISKKGNARIRRILHMPALVEIRKENKFKRLYERVTERTSIKMKGIVAVQKKLLLMIYFIWKEDIDFKDNYELNIQKKEQELSSPLAL